MSRVLYQVPVAAYLARLEAANFDIFSPTLRTKDWRLPFRVWKSYRKKSF
jgi:NADH dehydrogenase [ubiquinone] 1 alpha subcomplex assembly factor 6